MSLPKIVCLTFVLFGILNPVANAELVGYWSFGDTTHYLKVGASVS